MLKLLKKIISVVSLLFLIGCPVSYQLDNEPQHQDSPDPNASFPIIHVKVIEQSEKSIFEKQLENRSSLTIEGMEFESDFLDLDLARVLNTDIGYTLRPDSSWDLRVAYNADKIVHSVIFQNSGCTIAHITDSSFNDVDESTIANVSFTSNLIDEPFYSDTVILVTTPTGAVYKIGNAVEQEYILNFDYQQLTQPIDSTIWYAWEDYIDLDGDREYDFRTVYSSDGEYHLRIFQNRSDSDTGILLLDTYTFEEVSLSSFSSNDLVTSLIDEPITPSVVAVLKTTSGAFYKVGNSFEDNENHRLKFDFSQIEE